MLPPENAVGNYVKVVQRVPVKIVFDEPLDAPHVLGPGESVVPSVAVMSYVVSRALVGGVAAAVAIGIGEVWWRAGRR